MVVPGNTQRTAPSPKTTIRLGHSPDPDDAFMWRALANFVAPDGAKLTPTIDTRGYDFVHVLEDIQSLNMRSERGELEITSAVQYSIDHLDTRFEVIPIRGPVLDLTSRSDIESVAERLRGQQVHL